MDKTLLSLFQDEQEKQKVATEAQIESERKLKEAQDSKNKALLLGKEAVDAKKEFEASIDENDIYLIDNNPVPVVVVKVDGVVHFVQPPNAADVHIKNGPSPSGESYPQRLLREDPLRKVIPLDAEKKLEKIENTLLDDGRKILEESKKVIRNALPKAPSVRLNGSGIKKFLGFCIFSVLLLWVVGALGYAAYSYLPSFHNVFVGKVTEPLLAIAINDSSQQTPEFAAVEGDPELHDKLDKYNCKWKKLDITNAQISSKHYDEKLKEAGGAPAMILVGGESGTVYKAVHMPDTVEQLLDLVSEVRGE